MNIFWNAKKRATRRFDGASAINMPLAYQNGNARYLHEIARYMENEVENANKEFLKMEGKR